MVDPTEHRIRLLGARDGLIHALIAVSNVRGRIVGPGGAYLPPKHHVRRRAVIDARIAELDLAREAIKAKLDGVKAAIAETM